MTKRSRNLLLASKRSLLAVFALVGLELFTAVPVSRGATNYYFDPNGATSEGGTGTWDAGTTAAWSTSTTGQATPIVWPNSTAYAALFTNVGGTVTVASGGVTASGISITATGETFNGGPIAISTGGISYNATNVNPIFNTEIDLLSSAATSTFHSGTITLNGNVVVEGTTALTLSMSVNATNASASVLGNITAASTGSLNLAITGTYSTSTVAPPALPATSGTFTFSGNNTALLSTNTTTIGSSLGGGDVVLNTANALGASAVIFAKGPALVAGTFNAIESSVETATAGLTIANNFTANVETNANNVHVYNIGTNASVTSGTTIFSGNVTNNNTAQAISLVATKAGTITQFSGAFSGNAFATAGLGTISLNGTSSNFTGGLSVVAGSTLSLDNTTTLASATGATAVAGILTSTVANANLGGSLGLATGGTISPNGTSVGTLTLASTSTFTMSAGTLSINIASGSSYDQLLSSGGAGATFTITGGTLNLNLGTANSAIYSNTYALLNGFTTPGSVSGLNITNYDMTDYSASLSTAGVLSFTSLAGVPEPSTTAMTLAGLAFLCLPVWRAARKGAAKS